MIFTPSSRARVADAERRWLSRFILRITTTVFSFIALVCIAVVFEKYNSYGNYRIRFYNDYLLPWEFISLGVSILWNIANITVRLLRPRPMHPGANVALDLLLWMALFVTGFFATLAAAQDILGLGYSSYYYNGTTTTQDYQSQRSNGVVTAVGAAFTFLALILHFTLFVLACIDTHRRNRSKVDSQATKIAQSIVADMTERGMLSTTTIAQQPQYNPEHHQSLLNNATPAYQASRDASTDGRQDGFHVESYNSPIAEQQQQHPAKRTIL